MKKLSIGVLVLLTTLTYAQSKEIVPIILDGKPAFLNTITGKVVSNSGATAKRYKKIKLKGFTSSSTLPKIATSIKITHVVSSGETLYSISKKHGLTVVQLKTLNKLLSNTLSIGQTLQLQNNVVKSENISSNIHTVNRGESLYLISKQYHMSVADLKTLNNLEDNNIIVGQQLKIN